MILWLHIRSFFPRALPSALRPFKLSVLQLGSTKKSLEVMVNSLLWKHTASPYSMDVYPFVYSKQVFPNTKRKEWRPFFFMMCARINSTAKRAVRDDVSVLIFQGSRAEIRWCFQYFLSWAIDPVWPSHQSLGVTVEKMSVVVQGTKANFWWQLWVWPEQCHSEAFLLWGWSVLCCLLLSSIPWHRPAV